jgi:hypothetical protein
MLLENILLLIKDFILLLLKHILLLIKDFILFLSPLFLLYFYYSTNSLFFIIAFNTMVVMSMVGLSCGVYGIYNHIETVVINVITSYNKTHGTISGRIVFGVDCILNGIIFGWLYHGQCWATLILYIFFMILLTIYRMMASMIFLTFKNIAEENKVTINELLDLKNEA